jgi:hypothetical protein
VQFTLIRLFAAIGCFAATAGLFRADYFLVDGAGGGFFPLLIVLVAIGLAILGVMLLWPRLARRLLECAFHFGRALLELLDW